MLQELLLQRWLRHRSLLLLGKHSQEGRAASSQIARGLLTVKRINGSGKRRCLLLQVALKESRRKVYHWLYVRKLRVLNLPHDHFVLRDTRLILRDQLGRLLLQQVQLEDALCLARLMQALTVEGHARIEGIFGVT